MQEYGFKEKHCLWVEDVEAKGYQNLIKDVQREKRVGIDFEFSIDQ